MNNRKYIRRNKIKKPKTQVRKYKGNPNHVRVGRLPEYIELLDNTTVFFPKYPLSARNFPSRNQKSTTRSDVMGKGGDGLFNISCNEDVPPSTNYQNLYQQAGWCYAGYDYESFGLGPPMNNYIIMGQVYIGDQPSTNPLSCDDVDLNDNCITHAVEHDGPFPSYNMYDFNDPTGDADAIAVMYNNTIVGWEYINNIASQCGWAHVGLPENCPPGLEDGQIHGIPGISIPIQTSNKVPSLYGYPDIGDYIDDLLLYKANTGTYHKLTDESYDAFFNGIWGRVGPNYTLCPDAPNYQGQLGLPPMASGCVSVCRSQGGDNCDFGQYDDCQCETVMGLGQNQGIPCNNFFDCAEGLPDCCLEPNLCCTDDCCIEEFIYGPQPLKDFAVFAFEDMDLIFNPQPYEGPPNFTLSLHSGENLISFPIELDNSSLDVVFEDERITKVIGEGVAATRVNGVFQGSLNEVDTTSSYYVNALEDLTLEYMGEPSGLFQSYDIHVGNNYVAFPHLNCKGIRGLINPQYHGVITNIMGEGVAATYINGEYEGSLQQVCPGDGLIIFSNEAFIGSVFAP